MKKKNLYKTLFPDEKSKADAFDQIAEKYYFGNFGAISKSDIDTLMFSIYMDRLIKKSQYDDGSINYNACSDYIIGKDLGITQQKVRNLKIKKQLVYPIDFQWEIALKHLTEHARLDGNKIILNIPDPNLYLEIENFINENGAYVEKTLNSKVLQIRVEYYIALMLELEPEASKKDIIKVLKNQIKETNKDETKFEDKNIGKSLIDAGVNITTVLANISSIISPENLLFSGIMKLLNVSV